MPTLSDLTLQLSRDLSRTAAEYRDRLRSLEDERSDALQQLPAARAAVGEYRKVVAKAEAARGEAVALADASVRAGERRASEARAAELRRVDQQFREDDATALGAKEDAERRAAEEHQRRLDDISRTIALSNQTLARIAAHDEYRRSLEAAHDGYLRALHLSRDRQQTNLRAALLKEQVDGSLARERAQQAKEAAQLVYDRALETAQATLRHTLLDDPATAGVQQDFDRRRNRLKAQQRGEEERLFAEFQRAREALA